MSVTQASLMRRKAAKDFLKASHTMLRMLSGKPQLSFAFDARYYPDPLRTPKSNKITLPASMRPDDSSDRAILRGEIDRAAAWFRYHDATAFQSGRYPEAPLINQTKYIVTPLHQKNEHIRLFHEAMEKARCEALMIAREHTEGLRVNMLGTLVSQRLHPIIHTTDKWDAEALASNISTLISGVLNFNFRINPERPLETEFTRIGGKRISDILERAEKALAARDYNDPIYSRLSWSFSRWSSDKPERISSVYADRADIAEGFYLGTIALLAGTRAMQPDVAHRAELWAARIAKAAQPEITDIHHFAHDPDGFAILASIVIENYIKAYPKDLFPTIEQPKKKKKKRNRRHHYKPERAHNLGALDRLQDTGRVAQPLAPPEAPLKETGPEKADDLDIEIEESDDVDLAALFEEMAADETKDAKKAKLDPATVPTGKGGIVLAPDSKEAKLLATYEEVQRIAGKQVFRATDFILDESELARNFEIILKQHAAHLPIFNTLARKLERALRMQEHALPIFRQPEGHLDTNLLSTIIMDPTAQDIYRDAEIQWKQGSGTHDAAVMFLLDMSGSMHNDPIQFATLSARALATQLARVGVKVAIAGYGQGNGRGIIGNRAAFVMFKDFKEPMQRTEHHLGLVHGQLPTSGNADPEALLWARGQLLARPEKRKILFVMCDNGPSSMIIQSQQPTNDHLATAIKLLYATRGIDVVAMGIKSDVSEHYGQERSFSVNDPQDLGRMFTQRLTDLLVLKPHGAPNGQRRMKASGLSLN